MTVVPFVHEGLGNSSYLVELSGGEALLIDPDRTVDRYLSAASDRGWRVTTILETHLHADFVSGVREAAEATGARLFVPAGGDAKFEHIPISARERLGLGEAEIEAIASPGHTPEHLSFVLRAERRPPLLFSGGSLMVGGAARTDLISPDLTDELTRAQYRTLTRAFSSLPDETQLFPTHGGGSFCSAGEAGERTSTLGEQRVDNPLLQFANEEEFATWFQSTFPAAPAYFFRMRAINQAGPRLRREVPPPPALSPDEFDAARCEALVVDVRPIGEYAAAHIPGSFSNPFRSAFATWLGWLVPEGTPLLFVLGDVPLQAVVDESMLVGYESFAGWLAGGLESWETSGLPVTQSQLVDAARARDAIYDGAALVDVREPSEFGAGHIDGAIPVPLGSLGSALDRIPKDRPILAQCGAGERAASAASLLERAGFERVVIFDGGIGAWKDAGYAVV